MGRWQPTSGVLKQAKQCLRAGTNQNVVELFPGGFQNYKGEFRSEPIGGKAGSRVSRNAPCPCGSGKKFKVCCRR